MSKILTLLKVLAAHIIYKLAFLYPRSEKIWVCVGWHTNKEREVFADNSKYFFLQAHETQSDIQIIWLARDEALASTLRKAGLSSHSIYSIAGIKYALRAGFFIVDAFLETKFWQFTGGSKIIQLWHGKGMKKTGYDSNYSLKNRSRFSQPGFFAPYHKLIASSFYTANLMSSTFGVTLDKIIISGLPRNDTLLNTTIDGANIDAHRELDSLTTNLKKQGVSKILMYAPTFRPDGSNPLNKLDLNQLRAILKEKNYHLIISLHPKFARKDDVDKIHSDTHTYISSGWDVYPYLHRIDVLITDYSSLYIDFLFLDKQLIFYTYDIETYSTQMGLHDDFVKLTPGPHPSTSSELVVAIENLDHEDEYSKAREKVAKLLFKYRDALATQRIIKSLRS